MMTTYTVALNDNAKTEIEVEIDVDSAFASTYGLIAAIIDATHEAPAYKAARAAEDAQIHAIWIDGEEVTQF